MDNFRTSIKRVVAIRSDVYDNNRKRQIYVLFEVLLGATQRQTPRLDTDILQTQISSGAGIKLETFGI